MARVVPTLSFFVWLVLLYFLFKKYFFECYVFTPVTYSVSLSLAKQPHLPSSDSGCLSAWLRLSLLLFVSPYTLSLPP